MPRRRTFCLATGGLLASPWAAAVDGVTANQILVGQSITLEGGKNEYGSAVLAGIQACLAGANQRGGVHGRRIALKTLDDGNRVAQADANARQLVQQDQAFLLFGPIEGGPSTAVMKVAVELKVPLFGPIAGSPVLRRPHQPLVFPVRAEHRDEFRALLDYAKKTGNSRVAFFRSDSETGAQHLENVKLACNELAMELAADLPFRGDITDAQLEQMAGRIAAAKAQVVINHGSADVYERLIRKARALKVRATFSGVNSGSTQMVARLGELAHGMVFAQVVPSPWERKTAITREYQDEFARHQPGQPFSYGSLEGYVTAKVLVAALRMAGPNPTRDKFVDALHGAGTIDLGGLRASYRAGDHAGANMVDLAIVTREGKFRH